MLDECDRMMDMGFWPQLRDVQEKFPQKKQQLLFSATFPEKVEKLADNFLLFPTRIEVTPQATPATTVAQYIYETANFRVKLDLLEKLLSDESFARVHGICQAKEEATQIFKYLERKSVGEMRLLHSDKGRSGSTPSTIFKGGDVRILISTDVSARGIDVFEVSHVINFNIPSHYEDYVHRIGRTGRAFKTGVAISFMDASEKYHVKKIEQLIRQFIDQNHYRKMSVNLKHRNQNFKSRCAKLTGRNAWKIPNSKAHFMRKKGNHLLSL